LPFALCLLTFAFALCLAGPTLLNAQGCAMCYTSASAARAGAKEALANGVLILLVPPMLFFALIGVVVYKYRNKFRETSAVSGPLSVVSSPWSADQDPAFGIPQENGLGFAAELGMLEDGDGQLTTDNGRRTTDKLIPWTGQ
jgi:hypothetical protein